ncbi:MAG TPA: VOC family protein [Opitutaceae bacterium]
MSLALRLEHIAFNVADPVATAAWYRANLGLKIVRAGTDPARTHFVATADGAVMLELYCNPAAPVPAYAQKHFLELHLAFVSRDPQADAATLCAAGATVAEAFKTTPAGDEMIMLRDPFGLCVQLVKRREPML